MSVLKTRVSISEVEDFLLKNFCTDIKNIEILKGGEISQAFSFKNHSDEYVIKVRKVRKRFRKFNPFAKEIEISEILKKKDSQIPIPKVVQHGPFKGDKKERFIYSIVEKAKGSFVHLFPKETANLVDNSLVDMLYRIHTIDISETKGYGNWDKWNKAKLKSMQKHVLEGLEREKVFTNERFSSGIFEKDLYIQGSTKIRELVEYCSSERNLVHADFGFDNVLADKVGNVTAVFDWEHSIFGDFIYDIAWMDFWVFREENAYSNIYCKKYKDSNLLDFENYEERLLCYKLYIGMAAAGFFSESNQEDKYLEAKQRVLSLLLF
ncbi:MAG: phosphotransferase family protein [Candidatus Heimdallarchaeaceae archaeon]